MDNGKRVAGIRAFSVAMPVKYARTLEAFLIDMGVEYAEEKEPCYGEREFHLIDGYNVQDMQDIFNLCAILESKC